MKFIVLLILLLVPFCLCCLMEEKRYLKRKEKARSYGNRDQVAVSCNQLGDFYNQQGKYTDAVREYVQEAQIYASMGKELETAKAKRMVGEMYTLLCDYDAAKDHINDYLSELLVSQKRIPL